MSGHSHGNKFTLRFAGYCNDRIRLAQFGAIDNFSVCSAPRAKLCSSHKTVIQPNVFRPKVLAPRRGDRILLRALAGKKEIYGADIFHRSEIFAQIDFRRKRKKNLTIWQTLAALKKLAIWQTLAASKPLTSNCFNYFCCHLERRCNCAATAANYL